MDSHRLCIIMLLNDLKRKNNSDLFFFYNYEMDIENFDTRNRTFTLDGELYRYNKFIEKDAKSIHHIIWKMNRLKYNTNNELNKVLISDREHRALNAFFKDKQNPRDQLLKVFNLVKPVLSTGVKQELDIILNQTSDDMFYIPELIKCKKTKKKSEQSLKKSPESLFK